VQPDSSETTRARSPLFRLQKQAVGEPRCPLSIVLRPLPCEEPVYARRSRRGVARLQRRGTEGRKKTRCSPQLGGTWLCRPCLCAPARDMLPEPNPSRRIVSTAAMRPPIQRVTGVAIGNDIANGGGAVLRFFACGCILWTRHVDGPRCAIARVQQPATKGIDLSEHRRLPAQRPPRDRNRLDARAHGEVSHTAAPSWSTKYGCSPLTE
jgi:hypothetical protein